MLVVLLVTFWLVALSCEPLTASFEVLLMSPAATLVILFPPLLRPEAINVTGCPAVPLLMVTPALLTRVLPAVRLPSVPRLTSFAN